MVQEFNDSSKVHINRDDTGLPRDVLHVEEPYVSVAKTPQLAAQEYLEKFHDVLGIATEELKHPGHAAEMRPIESPVEYRFLDEKTQFDMTTVTFSQTCLGLPVWHAGVAIQIMQNPMRVISAQSTLHSNVNVEMPSENDVNRLEKLDVKMLAKQLGLSEAQKEFDLK